MAPVAAPIAAPSVSTSASMDISAVSKAHRHADDESLAKPEARPVPRLELPSVPAPASMGYGTDEAMRARVERDLRSDTLTVPSDAVMCAMLAATRGDDVYGDDGTTAEVEAQLAALAGKEAALFCTSGTASNQLAVRAHLTQPPYSLLCDARAHVFVHEAGGAAMISGAHTVPVVPAANGGHHLTLEDIAAHIAPDDGDVHTAPTQLVCLENTLNGTIMPQDEIVRIAHYVHAHGLKLHLDGARLWNVAAATGHSVAALCAPFDSVNLCLSKGLGAPIGSILAGPHAFIARARHLRKALGGGMRQTGALAAAAREALQSNFHRLPLTHALARSAQTLLTDLGVHIAVPAETNMVRACPCPSLSLSLTAVTHLIYSPPFSFSFPSLCLLCPCPSLLFPRVVRQLPIAHCNRGCDCYYWCGAVRFLVRCGSRCARGRCGWCDWDDRSCSSTQQRRSACRHGSWWRGRGRCRGPS